MASLSNFHLLIILLIILTLGIIPSFAHFPPSTGLPGLPSTGLPGLPSTGLPSTGLPGLPSTRAGIGKSSMLNAFLPSSSFTATLQNTMQQIQKLIPVVSGFSGGLGGNLRLQSAVKDCLDLFDLSSDELSWSSSSCNSSTPGQSVGENRQFDLQSWLSAALTNQGTCRESLDASGSVLASMMSNGLDTVSKLVSQCLSQVSVAAGTTAGVSNRKLVEGFPEWTKSKDRKLLQGPPQGIAADAVVAQDGSGKYKTVMLN